MTRFQDALASGRFVVTAELNPPKGTDLSEVLGKAQALRGVVDAFNLTDCTGARMAMAPIAVAHLLLDQGIEPILQVTGRDRNRIAIQAELLAASALGIENIAIMSGDPPGTGDHPEAKAVFDLEAIGILKAASALMQGHDLAGNPLKGTPRFHLGAVVNPGAKDLDKELRRLEEKIAAGARFFQTQAVYDPDKFSAFMKQVEHYRLPFLAGIIVLKSAGMARNLNQNLPGVLVPEHLIAELENAPDRTAKGIEISARIIREVRSLCQGVHIMAIGWERYIPAILAQAGVAVPAS
ncbi:Bifunctional homocysteine S-methyltransferase/5,10-methylenetetrahydrofolate reductase [bacterium HR23]|nr:Bifunctional homocysteine S-methyltransferase/5,10-methylenetetrahydrofolate reductase [bacterium HR23]